MDKFFFPSIDENPIYALNRESWTTEKVDLTLLSSLYDSELRLFGAKRREDFLFGRYVAHYVVEKHGSSSASSKISKISMDSSGRPLFPEHLTGSIAHSDLYACAYVTLNPEIERVGVDVETIFTADTYLKVRDAVFTKNELGYLERDDDRLLLSTIIFSTKESIYKCLHQKYDRFIDFQEVEMVSINIKESHIELRLDNELIRGSFQIVDNSVFSIVID